LVLPRGGSNCGPYGAAKSCSTAREEVGGSYVQ
jgi:hypothetical protein